jgi:membrane protease YdiL (CAAX protease family)
MTRLSGPQAVLTSALTGLAFALFIPLFISGRMGPLDFWWGLTLNVLTLCSLALFFDHHGRETIWSDVRSRPARKIFLGAMSAAALYLVFLIGGVLAKQILPGASHDIGQVYALKAGVSSGRIFLSLLLAIGPGEEVFWRGFLQNKAQSVLGAPGGWLTTSALYAAVHIGSRNVLLVLAAAAGGLFWGYLYLRYRSILVNAVSHTLWDVAIFLIRPVG